MQQLGYKNPKHDQIFGSAFVTAQYIKQNHPYAKKAFVIGMKSLRIELERVGINVVGADTHIFPPQAPLLYDVFEVYQLDKEIDIVVAGMDNDFTYSKLALASLYINEQKCKLVATNEDVFINVNGRRYPCAGTLLASLMLSVQDKSALEVVGKPNPYGFKMIKDKFDLG